VSAQRAPRADEHREPRHFAVHLEHGHDVPSRRDPIEGLVEYRRNVALGDRRDEPNGAAGVRDVDPASE